MSGGWRTEVDTMGAMRVPETALWGAQTARAIANFQISGNPLPGCLIAALGAIKAAAAIANERAAQLDPTLARAIAAAAQEVADGRHDQQFPIDLFQTGSGTSSNMNANEVIANRAIQLLGGAPGSRAVHPNDHVNLGQSSNDVFPSAVHLALLDCGTRRLLPAMQSLATTLHDLADRTFDVIKTGRTHLMDAMPIRMGQEFRGWAQQLELGGQRIAQALDGLRALPIGGTAVGTGVNASPGFGAAVCELLTSHTGLAVHETTMHFQAQSSLDAIVQVSGAMRTAATALFKVTNDIRWLASSAFGELRLPAIQPGSSIMPTKVNPVICEAVLMACAQVLGNDTVVAFGNTQGQFELASMTPLLARNGIESALLLAGACSALRDKCLLAMTVGDIATGQLERSPILATALTPAVGYDIAAAIAAAVAATGRSTPEVAREIAGIDMPTLQTMLDPVRLCGERGRNR
ncbi:MAG: class II fumarate hydratase [Planctomycetes bacterium]|nr:class II fumarate hydratase [Planctomycetota bacterium]